MKLGFYLLSVQVLGIVFDYIELKESRWFPPDGVGTFFVFRDYRMHLSSFVYYIQETLTYIALACTPFFKRNKFLIGFIVLEAIDLIDFILTGNTVWFFYGEMPVTFNIVKVFTFALLLANEFTRNIITGQSRNT